MRRLVAWSTRAGVGAVALAALGCVDMVATGALSYVGQEEKQITVQSVLQLVGAVEEDSLFRLCDTVVDHDTAGALLFVEELAEQGQDLGRLVHDLLEHLRHLLLVQHLGHVPESLPVT